MNPINPESPISVSESHFFVFSDKFEIAVIIFVCFLSALCCLHMSNTISKIPGNQNFELDVGYSDCFRHFGSPMSYTVTQILFFLCVTCLNVSSIVDTAEVVDTFFGHWVAAGSIALNIEWTDKYPVARWVQWDYNSCSESMLVSGDCVPFFEERGILFTIGYGITLLVFLPVRIPPLTCKETISFARKLRQNKLYD